MKRVLTALVLIPLVLLLVFKAPLWAIAVVTCVVALLATHEYLGIVKHYGADVQYVTTFVFVVLTFVIAAGLISSKYVSYSGAFWAGGILAIAPLVMLARSMMKKDLRSGLLGAVLSYFCVLYVGSTLATLVYIRNWNQPAFWFCLLFAAVWAGDTAAMYTGKALGRHKLAPVISPNKTWEGAAGSIVGSVLGCLLVYRFHDLIVRHSVSSSDLGASARPTLLSIVLVAVLLNIAAQLGDLAESVIKRGAGVKDSGTLLPGHGGVLDRIDALLFAAPVLWYYLAIVRP